MQAEAWSLCFRLHQPLEEAVPLIQLEAGRGDATPARVTLPFPPCLLS
jgi:hypothetical protein